MRSIFSPYRICPIGAHVDHQGGAVLGRTIHIGTTLEYQALDSNEIYLTSDQFGEARFSIGELDRMHWARYAQAAARVLNVQRGLKAHVSGSLIGSGLSSSASVGLAYIKALADVNNIEITSEQLPQLEYRLEHDELNLQIGLLDPLTIVYGRSHALLFMDTITGSVTPIADPPFSDFAWIVAYSGISRELTKSGFNVRVEECRQAASLLKDDARILSDVPHEVFESKKMSLPENLRKRATHFFTETDRVRRGAEFWREAKLEEFGQLMNQSCASSIYNYESGSEILIELHELVSSTSGIYGSRFSGGGYGGCVVALAKREVAEAACLKIAEKFSTRHPELAAKVFVAEAGEGLKTREQGEIRSAILLAAGRGKRQRPYTDVKPKPLLEVNGRATLDYVLKAVAKAGIRRVCLVTNHLEEQIFAYVGNGSKWNLQATFAHQEELRGNGDALLSVPRGWTRQEPFMVVATDYILEEDSLLQLVEAYRQDHADVIMSLKESPMEELSARSSVEVDSDWRVRKIIEKPKRDEILSPYAASVMFIFPPLIWEYLTRIGLSPRGEIETQDAVQMMIDDGYTVIGVLQPAPQEWYASRHLTAGS